MKKWIKRNCKWLVTGLATLFIANAIWGLLATPSEVYIIFYSVMFSIWLMILLLVLGIFRKVYDWWQKE